MHAIIESGYRTQTVHVVFGYRKHSNDHDYHKSLSLSDLLTLSQVWNTPSRNLNFDWDSVSRPHKLKLGRS